MKATTIAIILSLALAGCVTRTNDRSQTRRTFDAETGNLTEEIVIKLDSNIKASGNKVDMAGISVEEKVEEGSNGKLGDYFYRSGVKSASVTPQSAYADAVRDITGMVGSLKGLSPQAQSAPTEEQTRAMIREELQAFLAPDEE